MEMNKETKICKHCQSEISKKAKVCPNCRKKQGGILKWIVIAIIAILFIGAMGGSDDDKDTNKGTNGNNSENTEASGNAGGTSEESDNNMVVVGETLETDTLKISYLSCEQYVSDNPYIQPDEGYVYYRLEFEFENVGETDEHVSYYDFTGYADGYAVDKAYFDDSLSATLSAGKKAKGVVYFVIPVDATEATAEYETNMWSQEKVIFVIK